jgi:hypothetical protein
MVLQNKSDNSNGHALLYCLLRMVLQNKSDNCTIHALLKMFIAETYPFSRKLPGKQKFLRRQKFSRNEISQKFAHFRIIFAFRENGKNRFRLNPITTLKYFRNSFLNLQS